MNLTYENQGNNTYLVYQVGGDEEIDSVSMGMLTYNKIPGLVPTIFTQMNAKKYIKYNVSVNLYYVLFTYLFAACIFDDSNLIIRFVKTKVEVKLHSLACCNMVDNNTVFNRIYIHFAASSRSLRIRLIRIILPL